MNRIILQLWEESSYSEGVFTDGCSLHLNEEERHRYITQVYSNRNEDIPDNYDRILGGEIPVFVSDDFFENLKAKKTIKLSEVEFRNLIRFEELIFNHATL